MEKREEIKKLLELHKIKQSWLAQKLGIKSQTLYYLLNKRAKIDNLLYNQILEIIESYQYELELTEQSILDEDTFFDKKVLNEISNRLRIFAKRRYGTLKNLANALNISPQQLHQYVSGRREPRVRVLMKLFTLGCDINWLLGGAESIDAYVTYKLENEIRKYQNSISQISNILEQVKK
ncbi:MAG: helix-turn-helix transcriptional regulator [Ignavibacteriales bacterium]|nr:helix-turn-helix transcriptional regulator [Ignavibacteriales bacterium]